MDPGWMELADPLSLSLIGVVEIGLVGCQSFTHPSLPGGWGTAWARHVLNLNALLPLAETLPAKIYRTFTPSIYGVQSIVPSVCAASAVKN